MDDCSFAAGTKGTAYTLLTPRDKEFAPLLVRNLEGANQMVPEELMKLALQVCSNSNSDGDQVLVLIIHSSCFLSVLGSKRSGIAERRLDARTSEEQELVSRRGQVSAVLDS